MTINVLDHNVKDPEATEDADAEWVTVPTQHEQADAAEWLTGTATHHQLAKHSDYQPHESLRVCILTGYY